MVQSMSDSSTLLRHIHRRTFLNSSGVSLGSAALSALMAREGRAASASMPKKHSPLPHHRARVQRILFLYMSGGPSHLETFDEKPVLTLMRGPAMPEPFTKGQPIAQLQGQKLTCQGPMIGFRQHGESGQVISICRHGTARWRTTFASSARWSPSRSITIRLTRP